VATQDDIAAVVLMGGGLRIPRVQAILKETLGRYGLAAQLDRLGAGAYLT